MSTTISTEGGCVGVAAGGNDRPVLLSLYLYNGAGTTLRLTAEEARRVAAELLARAGVDPRIGDSAQPGPPDPRAS